MLGSKPGRLEMPSIKGALVPVLMHGTVDGMAPRQPSAWWFVIGTTLSLCWLLLVAVYLWSGVGVGSLGFLLPHELAGVVLAIAVPLLLIWMFVFYQRRGGGPGRPCARADNARAPDLRDRERLRGHRAIPAFPSHRDHWRPEPG